jgi:hypothetical protein
MATQEQGFLDKLYGGNLVVPILLAVCCCGLGLILGIVGIMQCQTPQGKANAKLSTIISGSLLGLGLVLICASTILNIVLGSRH